MDQMSDAEKQKLKHEALMSASQELKQPKEDDSDVDELQADWEAADEYQQFMSKSEQKVESHH